MVRPAPLWVSLSSSAIRAMPFGRYRLANALARFSSGPFLARLPQDLGGASYVCDLQDSIAREVCFTGRYEPQETSIARALLRPGMVVVDAGANWGYFALVCAHLVGRTGRVIALEPHPRLNAVLTENATRNALAQMEVLQLAAADGTGVQGFVGFDDTGGNSGLSRSVRVNESPEFECGTVAIDAILDARERPTVDLLKMDVEGGESDAILGMTEGLSRGRYRHVLLECHPEALAATGSSIDACIEPFVRFGYRGWHVDHSLAAHRRAAAADIPVSDLLSPIDPRALARDPWPHLLWVAPGEAPPA
jgi:FkbM family methyltransferase